MNYTNTSIYTSGLVHGLRSLGHTPEQVKVACVQRGISSLEADTIIKEAFIGVIGRGLLAGGKALGKFFGKGGVKNIRALGKGVSGSAVGVTPHGAPSILKGPAAMRSLAEGAKKGPSSAGMQKLLKSDNSLARGAGNMVQRAGNAVGGALRGMGSAPGKTLWGGTKNFGRGMMFSPNAKGVGGTMGHAVSGYGMLSGLASTGTPQAPQVQMPQQRRY